MRRGIKRILAAAMAMVLVWSLASCGKGEESSGTQWEPPEWVYVPEYMDLEGDDISYYSMKLEGDYLYYETSFYDEEAERWNSGLGRYSLQDGSRESIPLDTGDGHLDEIGIGEDGSIYAVLYFWSSDETTGEYSSWQELAKYSPGGETVWRMELGDIMEENNISYIQNIAVDGQGRIYISADEQIFLLDEEGAFRGVVDLGSGISSWVNSLGRGKDGKMYASVYYHRGESSGLELSEIDFEKKAVAASYENFPNGNSNGGLTQGVEHDFLVQDSNGLYGYDCETQSAELLFKWMDSDINGEYVNATGIAPDGRILAVINDWGSDESSVVLLTKTAGSEVTQKEPIVLGTMYASSELTTAAVKFNKANDKYRVYIKEYVDRQAEWTENTYPDALNRLNSDITSGNAPDIIDLSNLDTELLASKGALEDISSWLEGSGVLKREDYLENVLAGYTYGGVLAGIPRRFTIQTVVGSTAEVGEDMGWSLEEIIAYADQHPDANLFDYTTKSNIMYYCMMYNEGAFVDWSRGECHFNSPDFISLLNFVNRFPEEADYDREVSTPTRIQNGDVLLDTVYVSDFNEVQMYNEIYQGAATFIGYPTTDGSVGCALQANTILGITKKSSNKEGAWAFIEGYLSGPETDRWSWGFPSNIEQLNAEREEAIKVQTYTWTDEDGVEHEEVSSGGGSIGYQDGWSYTYHTPTAEEADQIMELIRVATPAAPQNSEIMSIISEEAEAFYKGQKSAEEVADVIQRRAQTYVDENS